MNTWVTGGDDLVAWANKLVKVIKEEDYNGFDELFSTEKFGFHNGLTFEEYKNYEFNDFKLNQFKLDCIKNGVLRVFKVFDNYIYVIMGESNSPYFYENYFLWDKELNKVRGNQYPLKIESKLRFVKDNNGLVKNFTGLNVYDNEDIKVNKIIVNNWISSFDSIESFQDRESNFSHISIEKDLNISQLLELKIFTNKGILKTKFIVKGTDFPEFIDNLYPIVSEDGKDIECLENNFQAKLVIYYKDSKEEVIRFPIEKTYKLSNIFLSVCLTDKFSNDWIILGE